MQAEVAKAEPTTAEAYDEATAAINAALKAFVAAKAAYDIFAAYDKTLPYADANKKPVINNETTAATLTTALRAYYESNAKAEGVAGAVNYDSAVAEANADQKKGWTGSIGTNTNEGYTDADGVKSTLYLDGGWSPNAGCNIDIKRTVEVPAGKYLLSVTARGAQNLDAYTLTIGDQTIDLPHIGSGANNGVFDWGWNDAYVEFVSEEGLPLELEVKATSTATQQWISINRFRLVQLEAIQIPMADAADYQALSSAIYVAEQNTLGFDKGQFAPYNNIEALEALAAAKKIDPEAAEGNTKKLVQKVTSNLKAATWTANDANVDAVFNGKFATVTEGENYPLGWTRTNSWGQMRADIEGDFATAYYNQPGSMVYGTTGLYTMPLAANTKYVLSFVYRSHENNSNQGVTATVWGLDNRFEAKFDANGSTSAWKVAIMEFTTNSGGNLELDLQNSGNTWMTAVSIKRAEDVVADLTIDENVTYTPADAYANVTLKRTFNEDSWNTFVAPFDIDNATLLAQFGQDVKVAEISELSYEKVLFTSMTEPAIKANVPVIIRGAQNNANGFTFQNVITKSGSAKVAGNYADFIGNYEAAHALVGGNYYIAGGKLKIANGEQTINGLRAYFFVTPQNDESTARFQMFVDGEQTTGIEGISVVTRNADSRLYNLNGQQVSGNAQKGIFIQNGKKVVLK